MPTAWQYIKSGLKFFAVSLLIGAVGWPFRILFGILVEKGGVAGTVVAIVLALFVIPLVLALDGWVIYKAWKWR